MNLDDWIINWKDKELGASDVPTLLNVLKSKKTELLLRKTIVAAIGEIKMLPVTGLPVIGTKENVSDNILKAFSKILADKTEDYVLRLFIIQTIEKQMAIISPTAAFLGPKDIDIVNTLKDIISHRNDNPYVRKYADRVLTALNKHWSGQK